LAAVAAETGQPPHDEGLVPGEIVATVLHLPHVTQRDERELGLLLRWTYGSAFGMLRCAQRRLAREPWASAALGGTLMTAMLSLFPLLGTRRRSGAGGRTRFGTHIADVAAVATVDDGIRRRTGES
jgi:hypothetical protein